MAVATLGAHAPLCTHLFVVHERPAQVLFPARFGFLAKSTSKTSMHATRMGS